MVCLFPLFVLAALSCCSRAQEEVSEKALYSSDTWQSSTRAVLVREQADVKSINDWLHGTNIPLTQVKCKAASTSDLCTLLTSHPVVVKRSGQDLEGVDRVESEKKMVASVMEKLFGPELHLISDYSAMKEFQNRHSKHMIAYARPSTKQSDISDKYLFFLKALLTLPSRPLPIAVTKQSLALPLSHRPRHGKTAALFLWVVSDDMWCQYGNSTHPKLIVNGIADFYRRVNTPFMLEYKEDRLTNVYREMGLFTSYVIHSPSKKKLAHKIVSQFVEHYCNFFMFLLVEKSKQKSKLTKALYLEAGTNNVIVIEPPITDMPPVHLSLEDNIEERDLLTMLAPIQEEYMEPEEGDVEKEMREKMEKEWDEEQKKPDDYEKLLKDMEMSNEMEPIPLPPDSMVPPDGSKRARPSPPSPPSSRSQDEEIPSRDTELDYGRSRKILEEDDHFGQLLFSLGNAEFPPELILSEDMFLVHIISHTRTLVAFYVPWEPQCEAVMHYMLQAMEDLPEGSSSSFAVVNCADYPDLCQEYSITHYPTVLLFKATPTDWVHYKGMMDSRRLLKVLEDVPEEKEGLMELSADTLPHLLTRGTLSHIALVVWAAEGEEVMKGGGGGEDMMALADSGKYQNFSFAWINCKVHKELLTKVVDNFHCKSLLLFDFQQNSIYQLPAKEWQGQMSLGVAFQDFISRYMKGALTDISKLIEWEWPPLQPPIKFPSVNYRLNSASPPSSPPPPPPSSPPSSLPPSSPPSSSPPSSPPPLSSSHHVHTEL